MPPRPDVTIRGALDSFATEQAIKGVKPADVADACHLLCDYLDGYAYQSLEPDEHARWESAWNADEEAGAFSNIFGPEKIPPEISMFLSWFMVRKVMSSAAFLRATGRTMTALLEWLADQGHVEREIAEDLAVTSKEATTALPAAERLARALGDTIPRRPPASITEERDLVGEMCAISRIEPGRLWISPWPGEEIGPVRIPKEASAMARVGWEISALHLARISGRPGWTILGMGNVYPL